MSLDDFKIFVIHYNKLIDRKQHIINQFQKIGITNYEFFEDIDRDDLYNYDLSILSSEWLTSENRKGIIAVTLAHFKLYEYIINNHYKHTLIFEDDVILSTDFIPKLNACMQQMPVDYDILFIGNGCNLHIEEHKINNNELVYPKQSSRCSDSYIVSEHFASNILQFVREKHKIDIAIDHFMNTFFTNHNCKVYWAEPTFVSQGSQNNMFLSSLENTWHFT